MCPLVHMRTFLCASQSQPYMLYLALFILRIVIAASMPFPLDVTHHPNQHQQHHQ